jgi:hypothetical protein
MDWQAATVSGMAGGAIVEVIAVWGNLITWQRARYHARSSGQELPKLTRYIDPAADVLVAFTRIVLGGLAGFLLHSQVSGLVSAVAVGAAAPALLSQLGALYALRPANGTPTTIGSNTKDLTSQSEGAIE